MICREKACACLEAAAADLKAMSYEELERFGRSEGMLNNWQSQERQVDGERVYVNTMICKLGRIQKRVSVELTLSAEAGKLPANTPCLYFERFKTGRFYPTLREEAREPALHGALPYVLVGVVAIILLALVSYLFM
jgi:hypothetical protein